jgi:hypothetical protein
VRRAGGDGDEKTVLRSAGGRCGDRDGGRLRGARGTGADGDLEIFFDGNGRGAGAALADAIEIGVVELAREVDAGFAVAEGQIFAAEERGGVGVGIVGEAAGDVRERAGSGFFVEIAVGVECERAQRGVGRFVGLQIVDGGIAGERRKELLQSGAGGDAAGAEDDVLTIRRDAVREIGGSHVGDQTREDFNGCVEGAGSSHKRVSSEQWEESYG